MNKNVLQSLATQMHFFHEFRTPDMNHDLPLKRTLFLNFKRCLRIIVLGSYFFLVSLSICAQIVPRVDFSSDVTTICPGSEVIFTGVTGDLYYPATLIWDFGPGAYPSTASGYGPITVTYGSPGPYTVILRLYVPEIETVVTMTKEDYITVHPVTTISLSSPGGTDNQEVCENTPLADITYAVGGWPGLGFVYNAPSGIYAYGDYGITGINGNPLYAGIYDYEIRADGFCGSATAYGRITVHPTPIISGETNYSGTLFTCPGSSKQLTWTGTPAEIDPWLSSDESIATVDNSGLVTGISPGTCNITFNDNFGCSTTSLLTVNQIPSPPFIQFNSPVQVGGTVFLCAYPSNPYASYNWTGPANYTSFFECPGSLWGSATEEMQGIYSVTATVDGCTSPPAIAEVLINYPPVITQGESFAVTCNEDDLPNAISLTLNATDNDGDALIWSISTGPFYGTSDMSGTGTSRTINYTPPPNFYGYDLLGITVSDGSGGTDNITVNITVNAVNDPPVVVTPVNDQILYESFGSKNIDLTGYFTDPDSYPLGITAISSNESVVTVSMAGNTLILTEVGLGVSTITLTASDGTLSIDDTFLVSVNPVQTSKTIDIIAGGLSTAITAQEKSVITTLTITGTIDARDFKTMRDDMPLLADLDISGSTIVAYTGNEGTSIIGNTNYPGNTIPEFAFCNSQWMGKNSLISVQFPESLLAIGTNSFTNCNGLNSIIIYPNVQIIGSSAFATCNGITSVSIPKSVTLIEIGAFISCPGLIIVDPENPNYSSLDGVLFDKTKSELIQLSTTKSGTYIIPTSVITIGSYSFLNCSSLTSITIPQSVKVIKSQAFVFCNGLTTITIPSSVSTLESCAFQYCSGLTSAIIPASVTSIGGNVFQGCSNLNSIFSYATVPVDLNSSPDVFTGINKSTCALYVPSGSKSAYQSANQWSDFMNIIELLPVSVSITASSSPVSSGTLVTFTAIPVNGGNMPLYQWKVNGINSGTNSSTYSYIPQDGDMITCQLTSDADFVYGNPATSNTITMDVNATSHFEPVWWPGNGMDHMNLYALTATLDNVALQPGDEIGIFDGDVCVGVGVLTQVLTGSNYLECKVSRDDPDTPLKDGYTTGNTITYKVWDSSSGAEVSNVQAVYVSGTGTYAAGATSAFNLSAFTSITQGISLAAGWNIMSFAAQPSDMSLKSIVTPLITAGTLTKIQDEKGNAIEKLPAPINWVDNIGLMKVSEGYKIKVTGNTTLSVTGQPVTLPYTITLDAGWNIMGFPSMTSQAALTAFNPLITAATLLKVQDEAGNAIEKLPAPIGWIDNIHNLSQGNGYKVKTSINTSLTINNTAKGEYLFEEVHIPRPNHFKVVYSGNGLDQMNIYFKKPTVGGADIKPGDEIGVFDGDHCVGAVIIDDPDKEYYMTIASLDDSNTAEKDGFTEGNKFELRLWDNQSGIERKAQKVELYKGYNQLFEKLGTSVLAVDFETKVTTFLGDAYPNPSTERTTFTFQLERESKVRLEIFNLDGDIVKMLVDQIMSGGMHHIEWNNRSSSGNRAGSGVYFYRLKLDNFLQTKQLVIR